MTGPLAYVFWHWKESSAEQSRYEAQAREFHASLERNRPEGFLRSVCYRLAGGTAFWVPEGRPSYEDWYRIESSAVLDRLDHAAVSPPHQSPHDAIARDVSGGAGGLYRLRRGSPLDGETQFAFWFRKPKGMTYESLYELLEPHVGDGAALWGRQMVLSPAPEFCLHAREAGRLPPPVEAAVIALSRVWP